MDDRIKRGLTIFIFQFLTINAILIGELYIYYLLPRYVNTIVGIFVGPVILFIGVTVLYNKFFPIQDDDLLVALGITVVTIWLPVMAATNLSTVTDFLYLVKNKNIIEINISDLNKIPSDGYWKIKDSQILSKQYGIITIHHSGAKNSKGYSESIYTIPIVAKNWKTEDPIPYWIYDDSTSSIIKREIGIKDILSENFKQDILEGTPLIDPFEIYNATKSMDSAVQKYGLKPSDQPKFLSLHKSYESAFERGQKHFLIFISIVYTLFIILPTIFYVKFS